MIPKQSMRTAVIVVVLVVPTTAGGAQQQAAPQMAGVAQAALTACVQAHPIAERTIDAANRRIETARQANSPAAMRAAIDDLQEALRQIRTDIAPCAGLQSLAADPHAGHAMPTTPQATAPTSTGTTTIAFRTIPSPPIGAAENQFEVTLTDRQGRPVDGADVLLLFYMPAMPAMRMPEMRNEVKLKGTGSGTYVGAGQVMMAGSWTVTVSVRQNGKEIDQQKVTVAAK